MSDLVFVTVMIVVAVLVPIFCVTVCGPKRESSEPPPSPDERYAMLDWIDADAENERRAREER